jgi:A/G-specific adenine glycosylase
VPEPAPFPPALRDAILAWYAARGRRLPFRGSTDPYAILVSEAMAQQTQAARAGQAWIRFIDLFPTVPSLAAATPAEVLRAWQGLGYNRRALNLWRAARRIVEVHGGRVPADLAALRDLPGVGPYTARAVAALAFGLPVGAVDTNVRRVLGRIVGADAGAPLGAAALQAIADAAVPPDQPGEWTHALMDLGAMLCRPRAPECEGCPARRWCRYASGDVPPRPGADASDVHHTRADPSHAHAGETSPVFATTSRWLRGQIIDRLRAARGDDWTVVEGSIGVHDLAAVAVALQALTRDGLVELDQSGPGGSGIRARLPIE